MTARAKFNFLAVLVLVLALLHSSEASREAKTLLEGIEAYKKGQYELAVSSFEVLANEGIQNPKLFYNLGNAYLKSKDLGRALLWYERARKIDTWDPDLAFNLAYAYSLTIDEKADRGTGLYHILFFWKYQLSAEAIQWIALAANALFWIFLILRSIFHRRFFRWAALVMVLPAVIFTLTALYNYYEAVGTGEAIVLPEAVSVRSGLSEDATELFVLHAGAKVSIQKKSRDYLRIQYTADKIGWVRRQDLGII